MERVPFLTAIYQRMDRRELLGCLTSLAATTCIGIHVARNEGDLHSPRDIQYFLLARRLDLGRSRSANAKLRHDPPTSALTGT